MIYPYDDEIMKYDKLTHKYVLTSKGVLAELGIDLNAELNETGDANNSTLADRILKLVTNDVYNWYYINSCNNVWQEYVLAKAPSLRMEVKQALQAQLLYVLTNGFVGLYSGINVAKSSAMDIGALRGRARVAYQVEDLGVKMIAEYGVCLNCAKLIQMSADYVGDNY